MLDLSLPMDIRARRSQERISVILGVGIVLFGYGPVVWNLLACPGVVGPKDWAFSAGMLEVLRKSVWDFGQFPWWNPYSAGGFPYFASSLNPGPLSLPAILSGCMHAPSALKVTVLLGAILGFFGMYRLAGRWTQHPLFRCVASILFCGNGGIVLHLSVGHLFFDYFFYPWIIELCLQISDHPRSARALLAALGAGSLLGLSCHFIIHYGFVYTLLTVAGLGGYAVFRSLRSDRPAWRPCVRCYGLLVLSFVAVGGFRVIPCLVVAHDYPRIQSIPVHAGFAFFRLLLMPGQHLQTQPHMGLGWWEWGSYVGLCSTVLFALSLKNHRAAYHWVFLIGSVMYLYAEWPMPYYWLNQYVPVFQSMRVPPRIRIWLIPYFAWGVVAGLQWLGRRRQRLAYALSSLILFDVSVNALYAFHRAFHDPSERVPADDLPANTKQFPVTYHDQNRQFSLYDAIQRGYVRFPGYEPAISDQLWELRPTQNPIRGVNDSDYRGEYFTSKGVVDPVEWSPHRIVFEGLHEPLNVNQHPGSYWTVNGREMFSSLPVSELHLPFVAEPDPQGRLVLEIKPKGWRAALWVSGLCAVLAALLASLGVVRARRKCSEDC
jgi:hypothetical protein